MKLFKSLLSSHSALLKEVAVSTCLIGGTAGIVFGISAGTFAIHYINQQSAEKRWAAYKNPMANYYSEKIDSKWNMEERDVGGGKTIRGVAAPHFQKWTDNPATTPFTDNKDLEFARLHPGFVKDEWTVPWQKFSDLKMDTGFGTTIDPDTRRARYAFNSMVIDGATHTSLDRSFNQSMYTGLVDFNQNKVVDRIDPDSKTDAGTYNVARTFKPVQDNTTSFVEVYKSALMNHDLVALAGFSHTTPLDALMEHKDEGGKWLSGTVSNPNPTINQQINQTPFILVDANCPNNQNVASSVFRADQPGFLSAIAACQYFYNNLQMYHNHYQNIAVSLYGGVAIPAVVNYMGGFQRGIEFFNEFILKPIIFTGGQEYFGVRSEKTIHYESFCNLLSFSKYKDDIEGLAKDPTGWPIFKEEYIDNNRFFNEYSIRIIKLGNIETHFTGGFAIGDAIGISKQLLNRGASAIICVAGPEACDTAQEIVNQNSKCIVIGVDTALEDSDYQRYHAGCGPKTREEPNLNDPYYDHTQDKDGKYSSQTNSIIKFSCLKDIRTVTREITRLCATGKNWDVSKDPSTNTEPDPQRAICGPGFQTCGNILNGLISISWDGFVPLMQALQHIEFNDTQSFEAHWTKAVTDYKNDIGEDAWGDLPGGYTNETEGVWKIDNTLTFNKGSPFYECYIHTIQILGRLFSDEDSMLLFTPELSLWHDEEGKIIPMPQPKNMTISEWLDTNMYFYT